MDRPKCRAPLDHFRNLYHPRRPTIPNITDATPPKAPDSSRRVGRKTFNTYLYELFGAPNPTDIRPDYAFSDDHGRYHLEVFLDTRDGMILAVHLDSGPAGEVDVLTFRKDS